MNQETYNKSKSPDIETVINVSIVMTWACCKNEWRKDSDEVTERQTGERKRKQEDLDKVDIELSLRTVILKSWRTGVLDSTGALIEQEYWTEQEYCTEQEHW
jgi:hypothetical protein